MPPPQPNRRKDDFDMAKLQKSLKQQQRSSQNGHPYVAKLSPAEIRSLNNKAAIKANAVHPAKRSFQSVHRSSQGSPPATPEYQSAYSSQLARAVTVNLPTPPHSPNSQQRRASQSSVENGACVHTYHHQTTLAPRNRPSVQSQLGAANGASSRASSLSNSSHQSLPTYRGHEVTRNHGTVSMLQRPAQDIVTHPLSMFSRPRQSTLNPALNSSTDKFKRDFDDIDPYQAQAMLHSDNTNESEVPQPKRSPPPPAMNHDQPAIRQPLRMPFSSPDRRDTRSPKVDVRQDRSQSPKKTNNVRSHATKPQTGEPLPTPREYDIKQSLTAAVKPSSEMTALPAVPTEKEPTDGKSSAVPTSRYKAQSKSSQLVKEGSVQQPVKSTATLPKEAATKTPAKVTAQAPKEASHESDKEQFQPKNKPRKRFSFTAAFLDKKDKESATLLNKKDPRETTPLQANSSPKESESKSQAPQTEKKGRPTTPEERKAETFPQSPAVRPPTRSRSSDDIPRAQSPMETKGKGREINPLPLSIPGGPVYHRCACCGRLKRPPGYTTELSPVIENEHLRTNFSFEAERAKSSHSRRSSDSSLTSRFKRHTPIIPMEVHDENDTQNVRTVQASIEPLLEDKPLERKNRLSEPARVTRFSSLHNKLDTVGEPSSDEVVVDSEAIVDLPPASESQTSDSPPRLSLGLNPEASMSGALSIEEPAPPADDVIKTVKRAPTQDVISVVRPPNASWGKEEHDPSASSERVHEVSPVAANNIGAAGKPEISRSNDPSAPGSDSKISPSLQAESQASQKDEKSTKKQEKADKKALEKMKAEMKDLEERHRKEHRAKAKEQEKQQQKSLKQQKEEQARKLKEEKRASMKPYGTSDLAPKSTAKFLNVTRPKSMFVGRDSSERTEDETTTTNATTTTTTSMNQRPVSDLLVVSGSSGKEESAAVEKPSKPTTNRLSKVPKLKQRPSAEPDNSHAPKLSLGFGAGGLGDFSDLNLDQGSALPAPNLGPHFARSSTNLRDFVVSLNSQQPQQGVAVGT